MTHAAYFIGVDVGTGSARAGIFGLHGQPVAHASQNISLSEDRHGQGEQSSREIWEAVCIDCQAAMAEAGLAKSSIRGIGFDATCSLLVIGPDGTGLCDGEHGFGDRDIIVWMDHRATDQAARINRTGHRVLDHVGGVISPKMETPKLLWLKEKLSQTYQRARHFFDLTDCTGLATLRPAQPEPVPLGAAMLGATASGAFASLQGVIAKMSGRGEVIAPAAGAVAALHERRFSVFEALQSAARHLHDPDATEADRGHAET